MRLRGAAAVLALAAASPAAAHQSPHPKFLTLRLGCAKTQLVVWYALQPGEASQEARARADRDHDGAVSPDEQDHLREELMGVATMTLRLEQDGAPLPLPDPRNPVLSNGAEPASSPLELGVTFTLDLPSPWADGHPHRLLVRDHHRDPKYAVPLRVIPDPRLSWGAPVAGLEVLTGEGAPLRRGDTALLYVAPGGCSHR